MEVFSNFRDENKNIWNHHLAIYRGMIHQLHPSGALDQTASKAAELILWVHKRKKPWF